MRYLLSFIIVCLLSVNAYAQHSWYLSSGVGATINNVSNNNGYYSDPGYYNAEPNILFDLKLAKQVNKHWQVGLAVETGQIRTKVWTKIETYEYDWLVDAYSYYDEVRLVSPNIAPAVFANYLLNFGRGSYMYAGPQLGIITGGNQLNLSQAVLPQAGANVGIALALTKNTKLQINNGWRIARYGRSKNDGIKESVTPDRYTIRRHSGVTLNYFTFTVGIVAGL